ncbi:hypothetical protein, partial [Aliarcobacter butzleri]|uniref:hypothetical protein n=1 Tax=Aliarcobacter butzleri TaxID=28197 RepID=UPI003AF52B81
LRVFSDSCTEFFIRGAEVFVMCPSSIPGLGNSDGFEFQLQAGANMSREELLKAKDSLLESLKSSDIIVGARVEGT